jgi:autophagy-related protein 17
MDEHQETASLVSRFLQSKKALAQGQFLCSHASELNAATVSVIVDALAFESKAKWLSEGVTEQLNVSRNY